MTNRALFILMTVALLQINEATWAKGGAMRTEWKWSLSAMVVGLVVAGSASAKIQVQVPAVLDRGAPITETIRNECYVEQLVGDKIFQKVKEKNSDAMQLTQPGQAGSDPFLKLTLLAVDGEGSALLGSNKHINVRVDLLVNGQTIATKEFMQGSSAMGLRSCSVMDSLADALGKDIAAWLPSALQAIPATPIKKDPTSLRNQPDKHSRYMPPATNFAAIDDVSAIPSNEEARANYRQYLSMSPPKAFVIYSTGRTRAYEGDADVMVKSLDTCVSERKACWLYAVDDRVVWSANEGLRTGLSARLRKKNNY